MLSGDLGWALGLLTFSLVLFLPTMLSTTNEANTSAKNGLSVLNSATQEIERLVDTMAESETAVDKLAKDSEEIRSVIFLVSGITEQKN